MLACMPSGVIRPRVNADVQICGFLDLKMTKPNYKPITDPNSNPNAKPNTKQTLILI